jgi:pyruvate/oxaloacetate carboxyltransferase
LIKTARANLKRTRLGAHFIPGFSKVAHDIASQKLESYGADSIIIMDSAGCYMPTLALELMVYLKECLNIPIGLHAHNNLGTSHCQYPFSSIGRL